MTGRTIQSSNFIIPQCITSPICQDFDLRVSPLNSFLFDAFSKQEAESMAAVTCLALFTRYERLSLERIVGEERALHMLRSPKNTFLFC